MNRDELYSRGQALPPQQRTKNGLRLIAPIDSNAGGTWISVNELGITNCLLNHYPRALRNSGAPEPGGKRSTRSRGEIPLRAAAAATIAEVTSILQSLELSSYRPFLLFSIDPGGAKRLHVWDGIGSIVVEESPSAPITTSSFDSEAVVARRTATYRELVAGEASEECLREYHRSHLPERGPYSVCVHRSDGGTRSLTTVTVDTGVVALAHRGGPPCEKGDTIEMTLGNPAR